ncbi:GNAT family N-acetyltransferase [Deinococcus petrolearius]|uniref:GNAT family N-acetyltransferase n=1 Tax=Deinococcus petrolearius TaxID=1751295 RepID=A0ABW1DKQ1_9DEIO
MPGPPLNLTVRPPTPAELREVRAFLQGEVRALFPDLPGLDRLAAVRGVYDQERTAEVGRCYVAATRRGQGVGQALMRALTAEARRAGYTALCLHTHPHLPGGFAFWSRQGFAVRAEDRPDPARDEMARSMTWS